MLNFRPRERSPKTNAKNGLPGERGYLPWKLPPLSMSLVKKGFLKAAKERQTEKESSPTGRTENLQLADQFALHLQINESTNGGPSYLLVLSFAIYCGYPARFVASLE